MATNPIGQGTKTIGINMKDEMARELEQRAKTMNISTGAYCRLILADWIENGEGLQLEEHIPQSTSNIWEEDESGNSSEALGKLFEDEPDEIWDTDPSEDEMVVTNLDFTPSQKSEPQISADNPESEGSQGNYREKSSILQSPKWVAAVVVVLLTLILLALFLQ